MFHIHKYKETLGSAATSGVTTHSLRQHSRAAAAYARDDTSRGGLETRDLEVRKWRVLVSPTPQESATKSEVELDNLHDLTGNMARRPRNIECRGRCSHLSQRQTMTADSPRAALSAFPSRVAFIWTSPTCIACLVPTSDKSAQDRVRYKTQRKTPAVYTKKSYAKLTSTCRRHQTPAKSDLATQETLSPCKYNCTST